MSSVQTFARGVLLPFALSLACAARPAAAQEATTLTPPPRASKPAPRKPVIRQTSPATCGPAALATLLTFYLDDPATEAEMVALTGTDAKTMSKLSELRNACRARGHRADGYRLQLPQLLREIERGGVPVVVHFKEPLQHYVLAVAGVGDFILVADPARGEVAMHRGDFLRRWDGYALVVRPTRPVDGALAERRRRAAETRLQTLRRAGSLMSSTRF